MSIGATDFVMMIAALATAATTICYTIATIFICQANKKSAKAADEQAKAMQAQSDELLRQYRESNRARIAIRFGYDDAVGKYLILKNVGKSDAGGVKVRLNVDFMKALDAVFPKNHLRKLEASTIHIAAGQEFPILVCFVSALDRMSVKCLEVVATYHDADGAYESKANIDFSQYDFLGVCTKSKVVDGKRTEEVLEVKG